VARILFLLDEDSESKLIREAIESCDHEWERVTESLARGTKDRLVLLHACDRGATLVTRNRKHFVKALARKEQRKHGTCPVIFLRCEHAEAATRFRLLEPLIRYEYMLCSSLADDRAIVELFDDRIAFLR
jgi:hypothetical protein